MAGLALLAGAAVWSQVRPAPEAERPDRFPVRLAVGQAVDPDVVLLDLDGRTVRIGDRWGKNATVLYAWSTTCGCVPSLEPTLLANQDRHGPAAGIAWIAVDGETADDPAAIRTHVAELGARYEVLRDPAHRLLARLGFDRAALVAVLDGDGYLRWRGNPTERLRYPERDFLAEVLPAVLRGDALPHADREPTYGCPFTDPLADCPDQEVASP